MLGGAEFVQKSVIEEYIIRFPKANIVILFLSKKGMSNWGPVTNGIFVEKKFLPIKSFFLGLLICPFFILKTCKSKNVQTIFSSQIYINTILCLLKKFRLIHVTLIIRESTQFLKRYHGTKRFILILLYKTYHVADYIILQTNSMKEALIQTIKNSNNWNLKVINNPLNIDSIDKKSTELNEFQLPNSPYIVAAGRLIYEKGFDILIRAFAGIDTSFHLFILGSGSVESELVFLIEELGLQQRVHLAGFIQNPIPYFKNAFACVMSSRIEGFPNTLLQMMTQCGRIVSTTCTSEIASIPIIITCKNNSVDDLKNALSNVIQIDEYSCIENQKKQRFYIVSNHTFDLYFKLLN